LGLMESLDLAVPEDVNSNMEEKYAQILRHLCATDTDAVITKGNVVLQLSTPGRLVPLLVQLRAPGTGNAVLVETVLQPPKVFSYGCGIKVKIFP